MLSLGIGDVVASRLGRKTAATVLAIIFGVGHIYLGEARRGFAIMTIGIGLSLIAYPGYMGFQYAAVNLQAITISMIINIGLIAVGLGSVGFWIWQILDARKLAAKQQAIEA